MSILKRQKVCQLFSFFQFHFVRVFCVGKGATTHVYCETFKAFVAGFALDLVSVILVFVPIALPIIRSLGFDPVWFCILFLIVIQTSYLTPPMAPSIFYLRAISPPEITLRNMYRGVVPFIGLQILTLILVLLFPALALWLPSVFV